MPIIVTRAFHINLMNLLLRTLLLLGMSGWNNHDTKTTLYYFWAYVATRPDWLQRQLQAAFVKASLYEMYPSSIWWQKCPFRVRHNI